MGGILRANLATLETAMPGVACFFGGRYLHQLDSIPPRIVWVPSSEPFTAASKSVEPPDKSIATRMATVSAHVWGISYDQTEAMLHNLVSMLHKHFQGVSAWGSAEWGEVQNSQDAYLGWLAILPVSFGVPVLDKLMTLPTAPTDESAPATGDTDVTIVAGTPAESEINVQRGTEDFANGVVPTVVIVLPAADFTVTEGDPLAVSGTCTATTALAVYLRVGAGSWTLIATANAADLRGDVFAIEYATGPADVGAVSIKAIAANSMHSATSAVVSGTVAGL